MKNKKLKSLIGLTLIGFTLGVMPISTYAEENIVTVTDSLGNEVKGVEVSSGSVIYENTTIKELTGKEPIFIYNEADDCVEFNNEASPCGFYYDTYKASIGGSNNNTLYLEKNGKTVQTFNVSFYTLPKYSNETNLIKILQIALKGRNFLVMNGIDGIYGSKTKSALASFKHSYDSSYSEADTNPSCDEVVWKKLFYI